MPTRPASEAIRPRIWSASVRTSCSGSGSDMHASLGLLQVALQDERCRDRVDVELAVAALAQLSLGLRRSERLVHHHHGLAIACRQPPRELAGKPRDLMGGAVRMPGLA